MYSAPYGYGNAAGQPFNGAPPGQNPQMQPGPGPSPNQPQQQQMMYNQQYAMGPGGAFPGAPNPGAMMPGGGGPAGMMQNTGMPQMAANGQMGFQAPFTSSPYGPNVPSTAAPQGQYNPNYMMANSMGGYPMNPAGMTPHQQQMMQRMHQAQQNPGGMGTPNQQRQFPGPQGTPNPGQQSQFGTPHNPQGIPQNQTPTPAPPSANSVTTPQTPTFPPTGQGIVTNGNSTPVSPGSQARDQERLALLLEINMDLLYEALHLKHTLDEIKKEAANSARMTPEQQKERKEEESAFSQDYAQVFRRLQANLGYLAQLTTNKPDVARQPAPMYLSPPPFNLKLKFRPMPAPAPAAPDAEKVDGGEGREEREKYMKEQYQKLHMLFPGIDPTKEPTFRPMARQPPNPAMVAQNAHPMASMGGAHGQMMASSAPSPVSSAHQTTPQMANMPGPPSTQPTLSA